MRLWCQKPLLNLLLGSMNKISCFKSVALNVSMSLQKTKIVFSKGLHDFRSLIYTAQKSFQQTYFVQFTIKVLHKGLLTP